MKTILFLFGTGLAVAALGVAVTATRLPRRLRFILAVLFLGLYTAALSLTPTGSLARIASAVAVAALGGYMLGERLRDRGSLLAFFVTAAVVDTFSMTAGPTKAVLLQSTEASRRLLEVLAVVVSLHGRRFAVIGLPDLLGVAALFVGLRLAGVRPAVALTAPPIAVAAALAVALAWRPLPVFPFLAIAALAATATRSTSGRTNAPDPPPNPSLQRTPPG
jgi:hypothetical protein